MKKGCFIVTIFLLTVVIGSGIYFYRKYGYKMENFGKEKIMDITLNKLNEKFDELEKNIYSDSIKIYIKNITKELRKQNFDLAMHNFQSIIDFTRIIIGDGKIDSLEFYSLKKIKIENERPKKN